MNPRAVLTRRTLLSGLGLTGLTALTGCTSPSPEVPEHVEAAILDLSFSVRHRFRPFEVVAPGFVQVREGAARPPGTVRGGTGPVAPFAAVEVDVDRLADATLFTGLATTDGGEVVATYDAAEGRVAVEVRRDGAAHEVVAADVGLSAPFRFAFALCENQVTVLADTDGRWRPLLTERDAVAALVDLRDTRVLPAYEYTWGMRPGTGVLELAGVRAGPFGMTGLRDPHLVQHADGSPYMRAGRVFLTFTCAGLGFFQQAHWGVFALDPGDPPSLEQVAQLYFRRDGLVLGDHAGQIVRDGDRWLLANSAWGDFEPGSVHVRHTETTEDVLSGVHLLETEPTPLPTTHASWDPGMTRVDGRWQVAFVQSPSQDPFDFHPALAVGSDDGWTQGLRLSGAADALHQCEGPILVEVDGRPWLLASDGDARHYPVFDLDLRPVGSLDAPYPSNIPHPQLVPDGDGGWLMVTFDGTQYAEPVMGYGGHGDVVVMVNQVRKGQGRP